MWKTIVLLLHFFSINSYSEIPKKNSHLEELHTSYPHALLTDDFGVLKTEDLKINGCIAPPAPFSYYSAYQYWQCFEAKKIKMVCEVGKYDPDNKSLMSMLVISGLLNGELHEYISRRPIELSTCRLYKKDWQRITRNEKYICVSGLMLFKTLKNDKYLWTWIWGRYKTKKGCDSYFHGECSLKYQLKNHRCQLD